MEGGGRRSPPPKDRGGGSCDGKSGSDCGDRDDVGDFLGDGVLKGEVGGHVDLNYGIKYSGSPGKSREGGFLASSFVEVRDGVAAFAGDEDVEAVVDFSTHVVMEEVAVFTGNDEFISVGMEVDNLVGELERGATEEFGVADRRLFSGGGNINDGGTVEIFEKRGIITEEGREVVTIPVPPEQTMELPLLLPNGDGRYSAGRIVDGRIPDGVIRGRRNLQEVAVTEDCINSGPIYGKGEVDLPKYNPINYNKARNLYNLTNLPTRFNVGSNNPFNSGVEASQNSNSINLAFITQGYSKNADVEGVELANSAANVASGDGLASAANRENVEDDVADPRAALAGSAAKEEANNNQNKPHYAWKNKVQKLLNVGPIKNFSRDESTVIMDHAKSHLNAERLEGAIIGKVLGRPLAFRLLSSELRRIWKHMGEFNLSMASTDCFICIFKSREIRESILMGGPWFAAGQLVGLDRWTEDFNPKTIRGFSAPTWIRLPHLPLKYWDSTNLSRIASMLGEPLWVDDITINWGRSEYARICVLLDYSKKLHKGLWIEGETRKFFQPVAYEGISQICFKCGFAGHRDIDCCATGSSSRGENSMKTTNNHTTTSGDGRRSFAQVVTSSSKPISSTSPTANSKDVVQDGSASGLVDNRNEGLPDQELDTWTFVTHKRYYKKNKVKVPQHHPRWSIPRPVSPRGIKQMYKPTGRLFTYDADGEGGNQVPSLSSIYSELIKQPRDPISASQMKVDNLQGPKKKNSEGAMVLDNDKNSGRLEDQTNSLIFSSTKKVPEKLVRKPVTIQYSRKGHDKVILGKPEANSYEVETHESSNKKRKKGVTLDIGGGDASPMVDKC